MSRIIKPMRAEDYVREKIRFPVWLFPKVDGVRGVNQLGKLYARTLKQHRNPFVTDTYSYAQFEGMDGEIAAEHECHPDLCRITSSACSRGYGTPYTLWHLFDYVTEGTVNLPYAERYRLLKNLVARLKQENAPEAYRLRVLDYIVVNNLEEFDAAHEKFMLMGYEGSCYYDPNATHKEGKSSPKHGGVLRRKDFIDFEAIVEALTEGETNLNPAQVNELGRTFRSSHKENKVPNGMVGNLTCRSLVDVYDLFDKTKLLIAKDQVFTAAPGRMTDAEAIDFLANPQKIVGLPSKIKFFPKGMKDAPRFPQWQCIRAPEDM
jgi:DNA ligase-1